MIYFLDKSITIKFYFGKKLLIISLIKLCIKQNQKKKNNLIYSHKFKVQWEKNSKSMKAKQNVFFFFFRNGQYIPNTIFGFSDNLFNL